MSEYRNTGLKSINELNKLVKDNKSIAEYAIGFYIEEGGSKKYKIKVPIFAYEICDEEPIMYRVLVEFINQMCYIVIPESKVYFGINEHTEIPHSYEGKKIRIEHEKLIGINFN